MNTKKILAIGTQSDVSNNKFTGQSVMFDGLVAQLSENGFCPTIIDISSKFKTRNGFSRSLEYAIVFLKLIVNLLTTNYEIAYITTSQSKKGFLRDYIIVGILRMFKIKVIAHQYGANYNQLLEALNDRGIRLLKNMLCWISAIIVEGEYMKSQFSFLQDYSTKVIVIPNGLPTEGKHSQIAKNYNGQDPFVMFYLSNLIWSKGYYDVLCALDILVNQEKLNVKCIFAGRFMSSVDDIRPGISNLDDFKHFVSDHNLEDVVNYYQGLYGDEKDKHFYESNVFILPTYYINEGQPVSVIEAMSYGCVPIVTDYRHIPMMVNERNGCFVEPRDPDSIVKKIRYLIENQDVYASKSKQSILDYQQKFKFDIYSEKVINIINTLIA